MMVEKWRIISIDWAKQLLQLLDKKRILKSSRNHQFQELEKKWVNNTLINKYKIEQFWLILWLINHVFNINASVCVFVFIFIFIFILIALICYIYFNYPILFFFFYKFENLLWSRMIQLFSLALHRSHSQFDCGVSFTPTPIKIKLKS